MAVFGKRWSNAELALLETTDDISKLAALLPGRTPGAIKKKRLEVIAEPWSDEEIAQFPADRNVNSTTLAQLAKKLNRNRDQLWKKLKASGYVWNKDHIEEVSEEQPYPDHGKKWTAEELALFPGDKTVNEEILAKVQAALPRRKPSSIWPKMKKEGYVWEASETPEHTSEGEIVPTRSPEENFVLSLAYELGFRKPTRGSTYSLEPYLEATENNRADIAKRFNLPEDFTSGELHYSITNRITPFPWEMDSIPEVAKAYRDRDSASILEAAKALHAKLEAYING